MNATTRHSTPALVDPLHAAVLLGAGLPAQAQRHLEQASRHYAQHELAEWHLQEAQWLAPDHAAVLIGRYRFYFYKNRLQEALEVAVSCLDKAAKDCGLPSDWRAVQLEQATFSDFNAVLPRFWLFTLKGYAYLNLRLGEIDEGRAAVDKLLQLDPLDRLGARVLLGVIERMGHDDDGGDDD